MKATIKIFFSLICFFSAVQFVDAQNIVAQDDFENNELGWTENTKPDLGECIIMNGQMMFNSKEKSKFFDTKSSVPTLLVSEAVMPIDPSQSFVLSADLKFEHSFIFGATGDEINISSGFLLEYDDDYNFIAVAVTEKKCFILSYVNGRLYRYKESTAKMKRIDKNIDVTLKVEYKDYKLKVLIDDIEMLEMRKINIESPVFALFTTGKRKINFDNVVIAQ